MRYIAIVIIIFLFPLPGIAESLWEGQSRDYTDVAADYCFQRISDTTSRLWLAHSNRMAFGKPFRVESPYPDDEEQTENLPFEFNANFPGGSNGEYLYGAGLWVGGIKGDDTLVSHAFDYVAPVPELNPPACPEGAFVSGYGLADMEYVAVAYDTIILGDTLFRCQVGDCHDWYPLGIKVTSHSYTWESPPFDRMVIVEYTIENIDSIAIESGWAGIYADCDIGYWPDAHADDISGFLDGAFDSAGGWVDLNLGYSLDMNGDPNDFSYDQYSTRGAFGVQVLGLSEADYRVNYNWWVTEPAVGFEWAPRQDEPVVRDLGGSFATAYGDSNKYYVMSHPEIDYNQIEAGLKHPGWQAPGEDGASVTFGHDTRFLISAGPFNLAPSEEITFTVAFVAGDNVVNNPFVDMWFDPTDPMSVSDYYELLRLDKLAASGLAAESVFRNGYHLPPPGPPTDFRLVEYDDNFAGFVWSRKYAYDMAGYHMLQKVGDGDWEIMSINDADDTTGTFVDLDPETTYSFAIAAVDTAGAVGKLTTAFVLQPGLPHPPAILKGTSYQTYPVLEWSPSIDSHIDHYRLYRIEESMEEAVLLAEVDDTVYVDLSVVSAREYEYYVTAVSISGEESIPSPSVTLVPLTLTSGILALNANPGNITANLVYDPDFADSLFARSLNGLGYTLRRVDSEQPLTIYDLAPYSLVIIIAENRSGALSDNIEEILPIYLANGGKVILIVRHAAVEKYPTVAPQIITFSQNSFFSKYLMVDSSYIGPLIIEPGYELVGDLVGATAGDSLLPALNWDSTRVNQFGYNVFRGLPYCGYFWPKETAETIYNYRAGDPDSSTHGQVSGIRYKGDDYQFYLLNFPLSLMESDSAAALLRAAVIDLNEEFICGDINGDLRFDIGDIVAYMRWLFDDVEPINWMNSGDVDCNGLYDLADVLVLVNFYCNKGLAPGCCR